MMTANYMSNIKLYIPELMVVALMVILLFIEAFTNKKKNNYVIVTILSSFGLVGASYYLITYFSNPVVELFSNAVIIDPFSSVMKLIMVMGTLGVIYLSQNSKDIYCEFKNEFIILSLGVLIGGMVLASASNLLTIYIGIETMSILSYSLAAMKKNDELSSEAGLKYVLYGGLASGIMLFGMSHLYGLFGTIYIYSLADKFVGLSLEQLIVVIPSLLMFFVGIGYKISTVPFHMWTPDVYEGSPIPVTAFFSIVPKIAGLAVLFRITTVIVHGSGAIEISWIMFLSVVAALTMTVGNVAAIGQRSVKRMLAYSAISHAGFMLLGVLTVSQLGARSLVFYLIVYLFTNLVAFGITEFVSDKSGNDYFDRFSGLIYRYPLMAILMTIVMLSLAGVPPLAGFVAKFNIFAAIIEKGFYGLAIIAGLNSVVSLYYYMKIVRLMIFKNAESSEEIPGFRFSNQLVMVAFSFPVVFLGIFWEQVLAISNGAQIFIK